MMIVDARGRRLELPSPPRRVVSLVPSLTETLFDLGAGDSVAGVTQYCIFPPDITAPRLGGTKNPDIDAIEKLQPDLVYMNLEENLARHAERIERFAPLYVSEPKRIEDVVTLIGDLGTIHGQEARAAALTDGIRQEASLPVIPFTFLCPIWKSPWMWCGGDTYVSHLITACGGHNLLGSESRYPSLELDGALALSPEVIFLPDEPFVFREEDAAELRDRGGRVVGPFPGHLLTWHGSRTLPGLRFVRSMLQNWRSTAHDPFLS